MRVKELINFLSEKELSSKLTTEMLIHIIDETENQAFLEAIAFKEDESTAVRIRAIKKIQSQAKIEKIAFSNFRPRIRIAAVGCMKSQEALIKLILETKYEDICEAASSRLNSLDIV